MSNTLPEGFHGGSFVTLKNRFWQETSDLGGTLIYGHLQVGSVGFAPRLATTLFGLLLQEIHLSKAKTNSISVPHFQIGSNNFQVLVIKQCANSKAPMQQRALSTEGFFQVPPLLSS